MPQGIVSTRFSQRKSQMFHKRGHCRPKLSHHYSQSQVVPNQRNNLLICTFTVSLVLNASWSSVAQQMTKMENHRYTTVVVSSQPMSRSWRHLCYMEVEIAAHRCPSYNFSSQLERGMPSSPITQMWPEFPLPEHQPGYREDSVFAFCYARTLCGICGYRFVFWAVLIQLPSALQSRALRCRWAACSR